MGRYLTCIFLGDRIVPDIPICPYLSFWQQETNEQINNFLKMGPRDFDRRSASSKRVWGNVASENV